MFFDNYNLITVRDFVFYLPIGQFEIYIGNNDVSFYIPAEKHLFFSGLKLSGLIKFDFINQTIESGTLIDMKYRSMSDSNQSEITHQSISIDFVNLSKPLVLNKLEIQYHNKLLKVIPDNTEIVNEFFKQVPDLHPLIKQLWTDNPCLLNVNYNILHYKTVSNELNTLLETNNINENKIRRCLSLLCGSFHSDLYNKIINQ